MPTAVISTSASAPFHPVPAKIVDAGIESIAAAATALSS